MHSPTRCVALQVTGTRFTWEYSPGDVESGFLGVFTWGCFLNDIYLGGLPGNVYLIGLPGVISWKYLPDSFTWGYFLGIFT